MNGAKKHQFTLNYTVWTIKSVINLAQLVQFFETSFLACDQVFKDKSVQEACTKCFSFHILEFKILQTTKNVHPKYLLKTFEKRCSPEPFGQTNMGWFLAS